MGLLDRLFGGGDPAAKWARDPDLKIEVDLETGAVCGGQLGSRPESLSRLGPPTSPLPMQSGVYIWLSLGLQAFATKGILVGCSITLDPEEFEGMKVFSGSLLRGGAKVPLGTDSTHEDVLRVLGEPWHRYADPEDAEASISLFYERRGLEWEVEIVRSGKLGSITLHFPPTLARPETRRLLRVEKPWPP